MSHDQVFVDNTMERSYYIKNNQMVTASYLETVHDSREKEKLLLEFQLNQMIADEEVDLEAIKKLKTMIDKKFKDK